MQPDAGAARQARAQSVHAAWYNQAQRVRHLRRVPYESQEAGVIELGPNDFLPLDRFQLRWRWTDPTWDRLPAAARAQILPLSEAKAHELWDRTVRASSPSSALVAIAHRFTAALPAAHPPFSQLSRLDTAQLPPAVVAQWLTTLAPLSADPVIVLWRPTEAIAVSWDVCCAYWTTFCYPASDDASILPLDESWCLEWSHDEYFLFGRLQPPASAPMPT